VLSARHSFASVARGTVLAAVGGWTVSLHVLHLLLVAVTATPVDHVPITASTLVWVAITAWGLRRASRMSSAEMVAALCCGAAAITGDGIWGSSPGHSYLVSAALIALVLVVGAFSTGRTALLGNTFVLACQCALLLASLGTGPLAVYVAVATTATTGGACLITWSLQGDLIALVASTQEAAQRDPLTGLLNRRGMSERFTGMHAAAPRGHRVGAVVLDLDHFKAINDSHGHDVGDQVLVAVAEVLRSCARPGDLAVRLGGEELAWLGAWPSAEEAVGAAEALRRAIAARPLPAGLTTSASVGVALSAATTDAAPDAEALSRLLVRADVALYEAKAGGRDRVVLAAPTSAGPVAPA